MTKKDFLSLIAFSEHYIEAKLNIEDYLVKRDLVEQRESRQLSTDHYTFDVYKIVFLREYLDKIKINALKTKYFFNSLKINIKDPLHLDEELSFISSFKKLYVPKEEGLYVKIATAYFVLDQLLPNKSEDFKERYYLFLASAFMFFLDKIHKWLKEKNKVEFVNTFLSFLIPEFYLNFSFEQYLRNFFEKGTLEAKDVKETVSSLYDKMLIDFVSYISSVINKNVEFKDSLKRVLRGIFYYAFLLYVLFYLNRIIKKQEILEKYNFPHFYRFDFLIENNNDIILQTADKNLTFHLKDQPKNILIKAYNYCESAGAISVYVMEDLSIVKSKPALDKMLFKIMFSIFKDEIYTKGSIFILSSPDKLTRTVSVITNDLITKDNIYFFMIKNMLTYLNPSFIL